MTRVRYWLLFFVLIAITMLSTSSSGAKALDTHRPAPEAQFSAISTAPRSGLFPAGPTVGNNTDKPNASTSYTVTLGAWRNLRPTESFLYGISMLPSTYSVNCSDPDQKSKGWIVGSGGVILNYCNGVWDHIIIPESVPTDLYAVQAISPTLGVAVGDQGTVLMYLWDRIALDYVWTKSPIPIGNEALYGVSMAPDGAEYTGWAVGSNGTLVQGTLVPTVIDGHPSHSYSWENRTASFSSLPNVDWYNDVQMLSPDNGWAVGGIVGPDGKGVIIHWDGSTWSVAQEVGTDALKSLHMLSATDGWVVGGSGQIYHFNGSTWSAVSSPTSAALYGVGFSADGEGWAVGEGGVLLKYSGAGWTLFTDLRTDPFDFISVDFTSGHGWLVGANFRVGIGGQILEYVDGLWLAVTPPTDNRLNSVANVADNDAWAVGVADALGGTIVHWDGKHWQRWFQDDLAIPAADLYTVYMVSATDGWAAGDPLVPGGPALFLQWDGHRWAPPRYDAPVNVRVNSLVMLDKDFGWAVADTGNAVSKYDGLSGYWSANHTCGGVYYQMMDTTIVTAAVTPGFPFEWDAWAVTLPLPNNSPASFLRYMSGCAGGYAWDWYQSPVACNDNPPAPPPADGPTQSHLRGIQVQPGPWGYASGDYRDRATIYYDDGDGYWGTYFCEPPNSKGGWNPSRLYSTDIIKASGITWFGGYYSWPQGGTKYAYIMYADADGLGWGGDPFPLNGKNIYNRPIYDLRMSSDTMGWAVGDGEDARKLSVIYQYPYPNFTLDSLPETRAVRPGDSTFYTVAVNSLGGFSANVSLSLLNLPAGITGAVVPGAIDASAVATIQLTVSVGTPLDVYNIPLLGYAVFRSGDNDIPVWRVSYLRLTVTNNPIYAVTPLHGPSGTSVTISGVGFGPDPGVGNRYTVTLAGRVMPAASVVSWADTHITVQVPDSTALFLHGPTVGEVSVVANGSKSNSDFSYQLENFITGITGVRGSSAITVTVTGTSLGIDPGPLLRSTYYEHVSLNGTWIPNLSVKAWSNNAIIFTVPSDTPPGQLTVTSNGFQSNPLNFEPGGSKIFLPVVLRN